MQRLVRIGESFAHWKRSVGDEHVRIPLRSVIVDSWKRSVQAGVNADSVVLAFERVPEADLQYRLARHEELLTVAISYCDWLSTTQEGLSHAVVLTDAEGVVLYSVGNDLELVESYGLLPGYDWSEERLGTNAIGTALKLNAPIAIQGPEHFHRLLESFSSIAAPLHNPSGRMAGAIALNCNLLNRTAHHLKAVSHLASVIDQELGYRAEICRRQSVEIEMQAAKQDAEADNAAKSRFLASVSHDLRTPLHAIIGFCQVIEAKQDQLDPDSLLTFCRRIRRNAQHQLSLINGILDLASAESGEVQLRQAEVFLDSLVKEILECLCDLRKPDVALTVHIPEECQPIWTDELKLKQILTNLVSNAFKYTQQGEVQIRVLADSDKVPFQVDIADTGVGIPDTAVETIFQPFHRMTHNGTSQEGTGLGLAISRSLACMLGYELRLASKPGQGSVFSLILRGRDGLGSA